MITSEQRDKFEAANLAMIDIIDSLPPFKIGNFEIKTLSFKTNIFDHKYVIDEHQRPNYEFSVMFAGEMSTLIDGRRISLHVEHKKGFFYPPLLLHQHEISGGSIVFSVFFNCEPINKSGIKQLMHFDSLIKKSSYQVKLPGDFFRDFEFISSYVGDTSELSANIVKMRFQELLLKMIKLNFDPALFKNFHAELWALDKTSNLVGEIKLRIENYINRPVYLSDFEDMFHLSGRQLNRIFKASESKTINQYMLESRLERALNLLLNSTTEITDLSKSTGFSSLQQFSVAFKRKFGMYPREYRVTHMK